MSRHISVIPRHTSVISSYISVISRDIWVVSRDILVISRHGRYGSRLGKYDSGRFRTPGAEPVEVRRLIVMPGHADGSLACVKNENTSVGQ